MTTAVLDDAPAADPPADAPTGAPAAPVPDVPLPRAAEATDELQAARRSGLGARAAALAAPLRDVAPYAGCVGCFVGAGLVAGGIVHHPLAPARYSAIAAAGVVVFLLATLFNEVLLAAERLPRRRLLRVVVGSLLLSLGIGMLSGGIQHFADFPTRAATLVPVGLVVSWIAFHVRNADRPRAALLRPATALVVLVALALVPGLRALVPGAPAAAHGHHHGEAPAATGHAPGSTAAHPEVGRAPAATTGQPLPPSGTELDAALADLLARLDSVRQRTAPGG